MTEPRPTETSTAWQQATIIMAELGETERIPHVQIRRAIEELGLEVVQATVIEARTTEATGGLLRKDGQRRTLGGVFFQLLRDRCTPEQRKRIFWVAQIKAKPAAPVQEPPPPPSEQALQIAGVIIEKLKLSQKKQTSIARDVDRVGVPAALAALRATLNVEQQGGRKAADGKRMKPLLIWRATLDVAAKQAA